MAEEKKERTDTNIVYVGIKPPMNYVTAVMALFNSGDFNEVTIKFVNSIYNLAICRVVAGIVDSRNRSNFAVWLWIWRLVMRSRTTNRRVLFLNK